MSPRALRFGWALMAVFTVALVGACGSDKPPAAPGVDAGPVTSCASNADCGGGQICRGGLCRVSCTASADCDSSLPVCDSTAGYCVECSAVADCATNEACTDHVCTFYCRADSACESTEYCVTATGACATKECTTTGDCAGGFRCDHFVCVPIDPIVCDASTQVCNTDSTAVLSCNADGTAQTTETCATGSICVADGATAACAPVICTPGELGCVDDHTAFVCDATGTQRMQSTCTATQYCNAGACTAQACAPSSVVCEGEGVLTCDSRGASATFEPCATRPECAANPYGCACASGACTARLCTPASRRCALTGYQVCATDGLSWGSVTACGGTDTCVAGECFPTTCVAGSRSCSGDVLVECNATGTSRTTTDCAATSQLCTGSGVSAACTVRACVPGALTCNVPRDSVVMCDARGASSTTTACPAGTYCNSGRCDSRVCTPGAVSQCVAGEVQQCNALGSAWLLVTDCSAAQTCVDSPTGATCRTRICTGGTARCATERLFLCALDGLSETYVDCPAGSAYCDAATTSCQPWVCTPSAVSCSGNNVVTCNARGTASTTTATCSATLGCSGGACVVGCGDGIVQAARGEACDDGNLVSGDGCSSVCAFEWCGCFDMRSESITGGIAATDLQLQYGFNGNVTDLSGHGHDGVLTGTARYGAACGSSYMDFNNTFYITGTSATGPTTSAARTMTFWIQPVAPYGWIATQYENGSAANSSFAIRGGGVGGLQIIGNGTNSLVWTPPGAGLTGWHHVAVVFAPVATSAIYVDGILRLSGTMAYPTSASTRPFMIAGTLAGSSGSGMAGGLDDFRVYNRVLTATEIAALADSSARPAGCSI